MTGKKSVHKEDVLSFLHFLNDLRSGMVDRELMEKYKLTPRGLGTLFRNLVNAKVISFRELIKRSTGQLNLPEMVAELRIRARDQLEFLLPISDSENLENTGLVFDISQNGVGTRGLKTKRHDVKTLIIPADDYFRAEPVIFEGICQWVEEKEDRWESAAGFRVLNPLRSSLTELQDVIGSLNPDVVDGV